MDKTTERMECIRDTDQKQQTPKQLSIPTLRELFFIFSIPDNRVLDWGRGFTTL